MCWHKWSKWEEYEKNVVVYPGRLSPPSMQGKPFNTLETWQKRVCQKCGYTQRQEVKEY